MVDDEQNTDSIEVESERKDRIERYRQAQISHYIGSQMMSGCDYREIWEDQWTA